MHIITRKSNLNGAINAIPSKSYAHRIFICSMLSKFNTAVYGADFDSTDILTTKKCIVALGCKIENEQVVVPEQLNHSATIDCAESGSTLRFMLPVLCALSGEFEVGGSQKLLSRPLSDLVDVLNKNGAKIIQTDKKITVSGKLCSGEYAVRGDISSQFITGLLLALPLLDGDSEIKLTTPLASKAYIGITLDVMERFGVQVQSVDSGYKINGGQKYKAKNGEVTVDGDWSNIAFWVAGAALSGKVELGGLKMDSPQGDRKIIDIVREMGAKVFIDGDRLVVERQTLSPIEIDVDETIDLVPVLSVLCANASGVSVLKNVKRLKYKESDRVGSIIHLINSLGGVATENGNNLIIVGGGLKGGNSYSHNDHRIAMSAMIAGLVTERPVIIHGAEAMNKSYPGFADDYVKLGGKVDVNVDGQ